MAHSSPSVCRVFVYGTLKPGGRYHQAYCGVDLIEAVPAKTQGDLYHLPFPHNYPAMTEGEGTVHGFLLTFRTMAALSRLDELEDFDPDGPAEKNLYDRRWVQVLLNLVENPTDQAESLTPMLPSKKAQLSYAWAYFMSIKTVKAMGGIRVQQGHWQPQSH